MSGKKELGSRIGKVGHMRGGTSEASSAWWLFLSKRSIIRLGSWGFPGTCDLLQRLAQAADRRPSWVSADSEVQGQPLSGLTLRCEGNLRRVFVVLFRRP